MQAKIPTGQPAPNFTLFDLYRIPHSLSEFRGGITILNFWSCECPWAESVDYKLSPLLEKWGPQVKIVRIASNSNETPDLILQIADKRKLPLVLIDADQLVADLYGAVTTPHFAVVDSQGFLCYQGAFDDTTFRHRTPTHFYLEHAVENLLIGRLYDPAITSPYGCAIVRYMDLKHPDK